MCLDLKSKINSAHLNRIGWKNKCISARQRRQGYLRHNGSRGPLVTILASPLLSGQIKAELEGMQWAQRALRIFFFNSCMEGMLNRSKLYTNCYVCNAFVGNRTLHSSSLTRDDAVGDEKSFHIALQSKSQVQNSSLKKCKGILFIPTCSASGSSKIWMWFKSITRTIFIQSARLLDVWVPRVKSSQCQ